MYLRLLALRWWYSVCVCVCVESHCIHGDVIYLFLWTFFVYEKRKCISFSVKLYWRYFHELDGDLCRLHIVEVLTQTVNMHKACKHSGEKIKDICCCYTYTQLYANIMWSHRMHVFFCARRFHNNLQKNSIRASRLWYF